MIGYLYRHIRLDKNEPFYIGIGYTSNNYALKGRYRASTSKGRNPIWKKIVAKTNYEIEILFEDLPLDKLAEKEIEFIKLYGKICNGTGTLANITDGGLGTLGSKHNLGRKHSEETKEKIKLKKIGICCNYNKQLRKPVLQFDLEGNFIRKYPSLKSLKNSEFDYTCVGKCCNEKRKTHKKFMWKYKNLNN